MRIGRRTRDAIAAPTNPTLAMTPTSNMMDVVSITRTRLPGPGPRRARSLEASAREPRFPSRCVASPFVVQIGVVNAERDGGSRGFDGCPGRPLLRVRGL